MEIIKDDPFLADVVKFTIDNRHTPHDPMRGFSIYFEDESRAEAGVYLTLHQAVTLAADLMQAIKNFDDDAKNADKRTYQNPIGVYTYVK